MIDEKFQLCKRQIWFDLRHGIGMKKRYFLVPAVIALFTCVGCYRMFLRQQAGTPTVLDYLFQCFAGMPVFRAELKEMFYIPAGWVVFYFWLVYSNGKYPKTYLRGMGTQVLVRSGTLQNWWIAKCIWTVVFVVTYHLVVYLVIGISAFAAGSRGWYLTKAGYMRSRSETLAVGEFLICAVLLPVLAAIALCLVQTVISLLTNTVIGVLGAVVLLVISAYSCRWYLIGNYLMILRNDVLQEGGVSCLTGIVISLVLSGVCMAAGSGILKRKDFIYRKGEL